jgi:SAM-dependent methyltransferase
MTRTAASIPRAARVKERLVAVLDQFGLYELLRGLHFDIRSVSLRCRYAFDLNTHLRNARYRKAGVPDRLPLPSPRMVYLVTGQYRVDQFYENGKLGVESITTILKKNGRDINNFQAILDFGCGCGRVMRHWHALTGPRLHGTDYNPLLLSWCRSSLPFAQFKLNQAESKLPYSEHSFDFVYAISVFSHFPHALQVFWIGELFRVLKPGGYVYMTMPGRAFMSHLSSADQKKFMEGSAVILSEDRAGTNACIAYTPEQYVRQVLAKGFEIVDFVEEGALDARQDVFLMKKKAADL